MKGNKLTLTMLCACYGNNLIQLLQNLPEKHEQVKVIIIHQGYTQLSEWEQKELTRREDVEYYCVESIGVTKGRNFGLSKVCTNLVLFCDDDVKYKSDVYEQVVSAHEQYDDHILTFGSTRGMVLDEVRFPNCSFRHNFRTILKVGTIEVSLKMDFWANNKCFFPEELGAGAHYFLCDEPVFLSRLMKKGANARYVPCRIGDHPPISSGDNFDSLLAMKSRVICFRYIYGNIIGIFAFYAFLTKNYKKLGFVKYVKSSLFTWFY